MKIHSRVPIALLIVLLAGLALLRQYGSGKPFEPLGIPVFPGFEGDEVAWMVSSGNLLHSWLGWALLVMIVGHIFMVVRHKRSVGHTDVLPRMLRDRIAAVDGTAPLCA